MGGNIAINMDNCNRIRTQTYSAKDVEVNCEIENDFEADTDRKLGLEICGVTVSRLGGKCEVATVIRWWRWW